MQPTGKEAAEAAEYWRSRTVTQTVDDELAELRGQAQAYERRRGCSSQDMLEAVREGRAAQTGEICEWMNVYHDLTLLAERSGRMTGIPTTTTGTFTTASSKR